MSLNALTPNEEGWALFLDVDGTLLELAETPQGVNVPDSLKKLLNELSRRLDGAVALVSGRSLANLDQLFAPLQLSASGVHGCERRTADGQVIRPEVDAGRLAAVRDELTVFVRQHEGLLIEDKAYGLAVHFRRAPHLSAHVLAKMKLLLERLGPEFALQAGKCVFELRPSNSSKGASVAAFMQEHPFRGRTAVYIGDDVTDESAFAVVNAMDGCSIRVGEASATVARSRLSGVSDVRHWLQTNPPGLRLASERP